jgi:hypothetical protein
MTEPDRFDHLLKAHLDVNPKSWAAMELRGVDETTPLQLDFEYTAPGEAEVRSLLAHLRGCTDYEFKGGARDNKDGTRRWMVIGTTPPMTLSLAGLNAWVTEMVEHGRSGGPADFDGWGVSTPGDAPPPPPGTTKSLLGKLIRRRAG